MNVSKLLLLFTLMILLSAKLEANDSLSSDSLNFKSYFGKIGNQLWSWVNQQSTSRRNICIWKICSHPIQNYKHSTKFQRKAKWNNLVQVNGIKKKEEGVLKILQSKWYDSFLM